MSVAWLGEEVIPDSATGINRYPREQRFAILIGAVLFFGGLLFLEQAKRGGR